MQACRPARVLQESAQDLSSDETNEGQLQGGRGSGYGGEGGVMTLAEIYIPNHKLLNPLSRIEVGELSFPAFLDK